LLSGETAITAADSVSRRIEQGVGKMAVLWFLVVLLIIFAVIGGAAVNNWLFLLLVIAVILALVGVF
jgi:hypothetical protein